MKDRKEKRENQDLPDSLDWLDWRVKRENQHWLESLTENQGSRVHPVLQVCQDCREAVDPQVNLELKALSVYRARRENKDLAAYQDSVHVDQPVPKVSWGHQVKPVHPEGTDCQECLGFQEWQDKREKEERQESEFLVVQAAQEKMESQDSQDWPETQDLLDPSEPQEKEDLPVMQESQVSEDILGHQDLQVPRVKLEMEDPDCQAQKGQGDCLV